VQQWWQREVDQQMRVCMVGICTAVLLCAVSSSASITAAVAYAADQHTDTAARRSV
jgi:hypothetical protein